MKLFLSKQSAHFTSKQLADCMTVLSIMVLYIGPFWWFGSNTGWRSVMQALTLLALIINASLLWTNRKALRGRGFPFALAAALLFLLYMLLNALFLAEQTKAARRVIYFSLFFINVSLLGTSETTMRRAAMALSFLGAAFSMLTLTHLYMIDGLPSGYRAGGIVGSGIEGVADFGNTIIAGMHYSFYFIVLFYLFLTEEKCTLVSLWLLLMAPIVLIIALTFARTAWLTCLVAGLAGIFLTRDRKKAGRYLILLATGLYAFFHLFQHLDYEFKERGVSTRDIIWKQVVGKMDGHWLFGHGLLTKPGPIDTGLEVIKNAHNLYLEVMYQTGVTGLVLFVAVIAAALASLARSPQTMYAKALLPLLLGVLASMFFDLNSFLNSPNLVWQLLWLPLALALSHQFNMPRALGLSRDRYQTTHEPPPSSS